MKIHIIGGTGSGKTYWGKKLARKNNIPLLDLDSIFCDNSVKGYGAKADKEKRLVDLQKFMQNESYIIEGIYYSWLNDAFEKADKIIILDVNIAIRTYRIIKRFIKRKLGLEHGKNETFVSLCSLVKWNFNHLKEDMPRILALKNKYPTKTIICKRYEDL